MVQPCAAAVNSLNAVEQRKLLVLADLKPEMLFHLAALHSSSTTKF